MPATPAKPVLIPLNKVILPSFAILLYRWEPLPPYRCSWRPGALWRCFMNRLIAGSGRGPYCHAAVLVGQSVYETTQFVGGRAQSLRQAVSECPGRIDVYGINTRIATAQGQVWDKIAAGLAARWLVHKKYGWRSVIWAGLRHTWAGRFFIPPDLNDANGGSGPPMCSQSVDRIIRAGGVELIPNCASSATEPNDFMRAAGVRYNYKLEPGK